MAWCLRRDLARSHSHRRGVRHMRNSLTGIALVGLLIAVPTVASAQAQPRQETTKESKDSKVARGDQHFMKEAAEGGMAEVQLGQLASQRASSDSVKQFGKQIAGVLSRFGEGSRRSLTPPFSFRAARRAGRRSSRP